MLDRVLKESKNCEICGKQIYGAHDCNIYNGLVVCDKCFYDAPDVISWVRSLL